MTKRGTNKTRAANSRYSRMTPRRRKSAISAEGYDARVVTLPCLTCGVESGVRCHNVNDVAHILPKPHPSRYKAAVDLENLINQRKRR